MRVTGGELRGRVLATVEGPGYRPATAKVREALFSMLAARGLDFAGARVADIFAGSGSLGVESLSRGAAFALFVEKSAKAAGMIRKNLRELRLDHRASVWKMDYLAAMDRPVEAPFDLVFVDPPYGKGFLVPAVEKLLECGWLARGAFLAAEVEAGLPLDGEGRFAGLELAADKTYGQTRIVIWRR